MYVIYSIYYCITKQLKNIVSMKRILLIYTDQLGTRFICPESETKKINTNIKKTNIMKNIGLQSRIELALLGITTILMVVIFQLFNNF